MTLRTLWLYGNDCGDWGARSLADMLRVNVTLAELYLGGNRITEDGAAALCDGLGGTERW